METFYGNWRFSEKLDGIVGGIPFAYRLLDKKYPNSKFIYTVRDDDSWLDSLRSLYAMRDFSKSDPSINMLLRIFSMGAFNDDYMLAIKYSHELGIDAYFKNRSNLLKFDVKSGWAPLCKFLGISVRTEAFPHLAKSVNLMPLKVVSVGNNSMACND
jgi:hypothetical protein